MGAFYAPKWNRYLFFKQEGNTIKEKTQKNAHAAFIGEARAYFRLLTYADKAQEEGNLQIALLFRAIAEAEGSMPRGI